jgi:hypothetical protein
VFFKRPALHRAIFKRSALAGRGPDSYRDLTRCSFTAPASIRSATLTAFIAGPLCLSASDLRDNSFPDNKRLSITFRMKFFFDLLDKFVINE